MRPLVLYFFTAALACAQIVSVGVKGGVPVTQALAGFYSSPTNILDTGRWTVGPTIELRLLFGFSVEADALYRGYREQFSSAGAEFIPPGFNLISAIPAYFYSSQSNTKVWDFPLLLKYRIGSQTLRPFVNAGYTFSHRTTDVTVFTSCLSSQAVCQASSPVYYGNGTFRGSFSENSGGPTGGVGVEYRYGRIKFAPEVRYTHLSNPSANLVTVMVGVTF